MTIPTQTAVDILWDLGYSVASSDHQVFHVARTPLAARYELPKGGAFNKSALEAFVFDAVAKAGCTALPTWC